MEPLWYESHSGGADPLCRQRPVRSRLAVAHCGTKGGASLVNVRVLCVPLKRRSLRIVPRISRTSDGDPILLSSNAAKGLRAVCCTSEFGN
jgi:hypothetical protein